MITTLCRPCTEWPSPNIAALTTDAAMKLPNTIASKVVCTPRHVISSEMPANVETTTHHARSVAFSGMNRRTAGLRRSTALRHRGFMTMTAPTYIATAAGSPFNNPARSTLNNHRCCFHAVSSENTAKITNVAAPVRKCLSRSIGPVLAFRRAWLLIARYGTTTPNDNT